MQNWLNHWSLALVTFLPLIGAAVMMAIPKSEEQLHKTVALGTSIATLLVGLWIFFNFDYGNGGLQFVIDKGWIDTINSRFIMGIDGLSLPLFGLTLAVVPLVFIYSWNHIPEPGNPKVFLALMLILETGMIGSFLAEDLILFFVFFEVVLLPMYFMIGVWGGPERQYASIKFFLYTLFGSALMIISFLALYFLVKVPGGEALNQIHQLGGPLSNVKSGSLLSSFDIRALHLSGGSGIVHGTQLVIFGGMFVGFAERFTAEGDDRPANKRATSQHKVSRGFDITPAILDEFKAYATSQRIKIDDAAFAKDLTYIKAMIHYEADVDLFGVEEARRQLLKVDPQAAFALGFFDEAKALLVKK